MTPIAPLNIGNITISLADCLPKKPDRKQKRSVKKLKWKEGESVKINTKMKAFQILDRKKEVKK